jgi:hypothetical protein
MPGGAQFPYTAVHMGQHMGIICINHVMLMPRLPTIGGSVDIVQIQKLCQTTKGQRLQGCQSMIEREEYVRTPATRPFMSTGLIA